jgi:hypothetical protein
VIRLVELKHVLGRRLVCRLLQAKLIVPTAHDARGHPLSTGRAYIARSERSRVRLG